MMNDQEKIKSLLGKFLEGQTTEAEEQALAEYFSDNDDIDIPEEWMAYKQMFESFKTDAYDFSEKEMEDMLAPKPRKKTNIRHLWPWASAACVAAAIAVLAVLHAWQKVPQTDDSTTIARIEKVETSVDATPNEQDKASMQEVNPMPVKQTSRPSKLTKTTKRLATDKKHHSVGEALEQIDKLTASVTTADEQVESYHVRMIGDGQVVTKHLEDGSSQSYIILTSADDNEQAIIPMTTNL